MHCCYIHIWSYFNYLSVIVRCLSVNHNIWFLSKNVLYGLLDLQLEGGGSVAEAHCCDTLFQSLQAIIDQHSRATSSDSRCKPTLVPETLYRKDMFTIYHINMKHAVLLMSTHEYPEHANNMKCSCTLRIHQEERDQASHYYISAIFFISHPTVLSEGSVTIPHSTHVMTSFVKMMVNDMNEQITLPAEKKISCVEKRLKTETSPRKHRTKMVKCKQTLYSLWCK